MPFPPGVQTVTVTAGATGYRTLDGEPRQGTLRFTPSVSRVVSAEHGVIALGPVNVALGASGEFTETLLAIDAEGFSPSGWTYRVDEEFTGAPGRAYNISLPASAGTVALASLAPVESSAGIETGVDAAGTAAAAVAAHNADTTDVHGITDTALLETTAGAVAKVAAHAAVTTSVHGIADTAVLETQSGAMSKVSTHAAATDPHGDRAYTDTQIAALSALTQLKVKTADESRTATTTVADDQHLFASLEANSVYRFRAMLLYDGPETADATITFTAPTGASGGWSPVAGTLGTTVPDGSAQIKMAARQFGSTSDVGVMASSATLAGLMVLPHGVVVTGATPGQLRLRWAQQTSNASPVTLKAGSTLEVVKVSGPGPSASGINLDYPGNYPSDQGLLAWTYDPNEAGHVTAQSAAGVAGRITLTKILLRKTITWSSIWLGLAGVDTGATLTNCYLGVYDQAGTLRGSTADLSATFVNASNAKAIALPLTASFSAPPGAYYIAMLLNGSWSTNVFTFKSSSAGISVNANLTAPNLRYSNMLSGQTSLPASLDLTQQTTTLINTGWASQWYGVS
ncbi:hypothetical protein [Streptomyces sp. NRRL S-813]|uniref:hypothetical protein n=1 Tax=Streptomyces sp. NRRL S-813 TaxID=1463919 RepID=UPI0006911F99|nr:hypothetical protein [Streptomyces sp. NRRL S-813]